MKNKHDDTLELHKVIANLRKESEHLPSDSYNNQLLEWLEELDQRRDDYKIEFYGEEGAKDNIKEFKRLKESLNKEIEKNNGEESNVECIMVDQLVELLSKMKLQEIRELNIFK
jgi:hypothetical protein